MSVYQHIQDVAKLKKISIRKIESDLGFSNGSIRKWQGSAPTDKLLRVANYLGTTPDYLILGRKNDEKNNGASVDNNKIKTIAAHINDDVTPEQLEKITEYIDFITKDNKKD